MSKRYIRSRFSDTELLEFSGVNQVFKCFELVGVFNEYKSGNYGNNLEKYYVDCVDEKRYHYRNVGVQVLYKILEKRRMEEDLIPYRISKTTMYRYGITHFGSRIIVHETAAIILKYLLEYIYEREDVSILYNKYIDKDEMLGFLDFQEIFLEMYIAGGGSNNRRKYAGIHEELRKLIEG